MTTLSEKCSSCGKEVTKSNSSKDLKYEVCVYCGEKLHDLESLGKLEEFRTRIEQNDYKGIDDKDSFL